jgi:arylsulfatase A-like enzyme
MHRREFLKGTLAASLMAGGCSVAERLGSTRAAASSGKPNILVILVDEMRPPPGYPFDMPPDWQAQLPNMLCLWQKSACFTNHFTAASDCSPSRATLVTGMYAQQHWLLTTISNPASPVLQEGYPTYGTILSGLDYLTTWIGKWHLSAFSEPADAGCNGEIAPCPSGTLAPYGFAGGTCPDPVGKPGQGTEDDPIIAQQFVDWLATAPTSQPWCTTVSFVNPHDIQWFWGNILAPGSDCVGCGTGEGDPPTYEYTNAYFQAPPLDGNPCVNFENPYDTSTQKPPMQQAFATFTAEWIGAISFSQSTLTPTMPPPVCSGAGQNAPKPFNYWYKMQQLYLYLQHQVDTQIGVVLNQLACSPFADNTIVIFTSDHGEYAGAHGQRGKGGMAYDEGMRVPFSVYDPTGLYVASPSVLRTGLTSSADFTSLLATLGNQGQTPSWSGPTSYLCGRFDMYGMLANPAAPGRQYVLYSTDERFPGIDPTTVASHVLSYRTMNAKLNAYSFWQSGTVTIDGTRAQPLELYDYGVSTLEVSNVANTRGELLLQAEYLTALFGTNAQPGLLATELQAPVDPSLVPFQEAAICAYVSYTDPVAGF